MYCSGQYIEVGSGSLSVTRTPDQWQMSVSAGH